MGAIEIATDTFTCHQEDDIAVITILEGAEVLSTTVSGKDALLSALNTIKAAPAVNGVVVLYSEKYRGDAEHKKFLEESLEEINDSGGSRYSSTYKNAINQFLEAIYTFPKPVVGGMDGDIGPTSLAINLAFDLCIATENASFFHPNLKFGLPPSPPLAFYLVQSIGSQKATEMILTRSEFSAREALDLGLITQIVSKKELKKRCIDKLRLLTAISGDALIETRRMLKPSLKQMRQYMDEGFEGAIRCLYRMKNS